MAQRGAARGAARSAAGGVGRTDQIALGVGVILASVAAMAFSDAVVKLVSADITLWQVFIVRSLAAIPVLFALLRWTGTCLTPRRPLWALIRSAFLVLTWVAFYASLPVLKLSVAAVAVYTNPIIIALLSAAVIGERVTARKWGGVVLGFLGVIAILKPGAETFSWFTLLPLFGAVLYAMAMVLTRAKCRDEAPLALGFALHVSFLLVGLIAISVNWMLEPSLLTRRSYPFLLGHWAEMGAREWGAMAFIGALSAIYFVGVAKAYQIAPPSIIAIFDYAYLIWAACWGFLFFAEQPDWLTVGGMILITAAGLLAAAPSSASKG